ncbi:ATP-binding protein [Vibrio mediterranei]|uniref:ATP-binding protein n=1 Tax=Vibrio mediterranei TaxID=689 RepID=UPI0040681052
METITANVHERGYFENLGAFFSTSNKAIFEALQNAHRANASVFKIDYDSKARTLTLEDDGDGVDDFKYLFSSMLSGWDESVQKSQKPFGTGFFSLAYTAKAMSVESGFKSIPKTSTADILGLKPMVVKPLDYEIPGTRVTLFEVNDSLHQYLTAWGNESDFHAAPVDVIRDGRKLTREYALAELSKHHKVIEFEHGQIFFDHGEFIRPNTHFRCFVQGLPVEDFSFNVSIWDQEYTSSQAVIHFNSDVKCRMPDRDKLLDNTLYDDAKSAILKHNAEVFSKMKSTLDATEWNTFVLDEWAVVNECMEHAVSTSMKPGRWFCRAKDYVLDLRVPNAGRWKPYTGLVDYEQELEGHTLFKHYGTRLDVLDYLRNFEEALLVNENAIRASGIDSVTIHKLRSHELEVEYVQNSIGEISFSFHKKNFRVVYCDEVTINGPLGVANITDHYVYQCGDEYVVYLVEYDDSLAGKVLELWSPYVSEQYDAATSESIVEEFKGKVTFPMLNAKEVIKRELEALSMKYPELDILGAYTIDITEHGVVVK